MSTGSALSSKPTPPPPTSRAGYVDVDKLQNSSRIVCVISQRRATGVLTFGIFREFDREGVVDRTSFIPEDLAEPYQDMVRMAIERMRELREHGKLPFPLRTPR